MTLSAIAGISLGSCHFYCDRGQAIGIARCLSKHACVASEQVVYSCFSKPPCFNCSNRSASTYRQSDGSSTSTAICSSAVVQPVSGWLTGSGSFDELSTILDQELSNLQQVIGTLQQASKKHHCTPSFLLEALKRALNKLEGAHQTRNRVMDLGGFRDVGQHTACTPLGTSWPLVEQALLSLLRQV
jgi:hypothetical protein